MDTGSFPGVESGRGMTLTPHPFLVPRSKNSIAIPLLSLRAFVAYKKGETYQTLKHVSAIVYSHLHGVSVLRDVYSVVIQLRYV
jgi:hypothetical protein